VGGSRARPVLGQLVLGVDERGDGRLGRRLSGSEHMACRERKGRGQWSLTSYLN
jgi:hypothetical protein